MKPPVPNPDADQSGEAARLKLTRELHEHLLSALVDMFGDQLRVGDADDPDHGVVTYAFEVHEAACIAGFVPFSGTAAVLSIVARLGRVSHDFPQALRWLGENRAFNTVALALREEASLAGDLWISANRNTLAGDIEGIRFELADFSVEVGKAMSGLKYWFPQFFAGTAVVNFENCEDDEMGFRKAVMHPREALEEFDASPERRETAPVLYAYLTRWLALWERNLEAQATEAIRRCAADDPELQSKLPGARLRALLALGQWQEVLDGVLAAVPAVEITQSHRAAVEAKCLFELDRAEEALETLRSAEFDDDPLVHFIRSCACLKLGMRDDSARHFAHYEEMLGADILARERILSLLAASDQDED